MSDSEGVKSKKKKKQNKEVVPVEETPSVVEKKQKKRNKKTEQAEKVDETVVEIPEKKKNKKRKIEDIQVDVDAELKPKKKLKVLMQIEDPYQYQASTSRDTPQENKSNELFVPMASTKLKKIIPQKLEELKKRKKKTGAKKIIAEPRTSLPRPVWTASGVFIEQPVTPFKFQSTKYVPIDSNASTKFGVVKFEGKQKKKQSVQQQVSGDFKSQAMFRNMKSRDGSSKNIRGLLSSRNH